MRFRGDAVLPGFGISSFSKAGGFRGAVFREGFPGEVSGARFPGRERFSGGASHY